MARILLDPGHGGGNSSRRGFVTVKDYIYCNEGQNNFYFATLLKKELEILGHTVAMTRNSMNENPSFTDRGSKGKGCDLLLSIHSNGAGGTGVEVWDSTNPKESDKEFGQRLCDITAKTLGINNRGVKYKKLSNGSNWYAILREGQSKKNMILEMFFHDNYNDTVKFINNHHKLAIELSKTISKHFGVIPAPGTPGNKKEMTFDENKFVKEVLSYIDKTDKRIFPSVSLAQAILESNWGKSDLAINGRNLFGIKAKDWSGAVYNKNTKEQDKNGKETTIKADFRKYNSWEESVIDHDNFFVTPKWREDYYSKVLKAKTWREQCEALKGTYATDISYHTKLIKIIEDYELYKYDEVKEVDNNKVSDWAKELWQEAIELKITDGTRPKDNVTREEAIVMIMRANKENK